MERSLSPDVPHSAGLPRALVILLSAATGIIAANLYYAQPLVGIIGRALGLSPDAAGLVVTLTQLGYATGILLAVPLGDLLENKRLVLTMLGISVAGLLGLAFASSALPYFIAAFATGLGASAVQVIVPYAAHFVPEESRGKTVGQIMSGLMMGIMLSRPTASLLTDLASWHTVFEVSAALMVALGGLLALVMPPRQPERLSITFVPFLASMGKLFASTPILRRRAFYQAMMFGAFCLFWTANPLLLAGPRFQLSQTGIAIFALVGVAGAISAPISGAMADRGLTRLASVSGFVGGAAAFAISHVAPHLGFIALPLLAISAILLDAGVSANLVLGQRAIFSLAPELRGRLNALYIASIFAGGATGSALGVWAYAHGGWPWATWAGIAMPMLALVVFATEPKDIRLPASTE